MVPEEGTPAGYGGARLGSELAEPPTSAFDGLALAVTHAEAAGEMAPEDHEIADAIASEERWMTEILGRLVDEETTLGNEAGGQQVVREALSDMGLEPVDVPMDASRIRDHPAHSPFDWTVEGKTNVVATWSPEELDHGRSLILNGHIDVVSPEPRDMWSVDPFVSSVHDGWLYGRGAADMKCGLAAILGAVKGLRSMGLRPHAPVTVESVVEEECTGNGTLQTILDGYTADAAIIAEPFGAAITTSQVGVLWFQVKVRGLPGHAAAGGQAVNAIEQSLRLIAALRGLEAELNDSPPEPYDRYPHPIGLNVGTIHGGDWPSTVPGECTVGYRIALYPSMSVGDLQARIEAVVAETVANDPSLYPLPPEVVYNGFRASGYEVANDDPLVAGLSATYARYSGEPPALVATTGTTDARVFGAAGIPAVCFGPYAEQAHGVSERVYLPSVVHTAQVMGMFIRDWCGSS